MTDKKPCKNCTCVDNKALIKLSANVDSISSGVASLMMRADIAEKALELACHSRDCYALVHGQENCLNPDKCLGSLNCWMKHYLLKATTLRKMDDELKKVMEGPDGD